MQADRQTGRHKQTERHDRHAGTKTGRQKEEKTNREMYRRPLTQVKNSFHYEQYSNLPP
jgi:hypothetical protein